MAIERWDPFRDMISLRDAMNSLLQESFVRPAGLGGGDGPARVPTDVRETEDNFVIHASLPGVRPDDVQITAHGDTVTIRGESRADEEKKGETWHLRERRFGQFQRSLTLDAPIDPDRAQAQFEHGILTLTLPKSERAKPKQIEVGGSSQARPAQAEAGK